MQKNAKKLRKIEKNWDKLTWDPNTKSSIQSKKEQNWEKLRKIETNWDKLRQIETNWDK